MAKENVVQGFDGLIELVGKEDPRYAPPSGGNGDHFVSVPSETAPHSGTNNTLEPMPDGHKLSEQPEATGGRTADWLQKAKAFKPSELQYRLLTALNASEKGKAMQTFLDSTGRFGVFIAPTVRKALGTVEAVGGPARVAQFFQIGKAVVQGAMMVTGHGFGGPSASSHEASTALQLLAHKPDTPPVFDQASATEAIPSSSSSVAAFETSSPSLAVTDEASSLFVAPKPTVDLSSLLAEPTTAPIVSSTSEGGTTVFPGVVVAESSPTPSVSMPEHIVIPSPEDHPLSIVTASGLTANSDVYPSPSAHETVTDGEGGMIAKDLPPALSGLEANDLGQRVFEQVRAVADAEAVSHHLPQATSGTTEPSPADDKNVFRSISQAIQAGIEERRASTKSRAERVIQLPEWNEKTGEGSIWFELTNKKRGVASYLGYDHLTKSQKAGITQLVLDKNGLSWDDAKKISHFTMPSDDEIEAKLKSLDAKYNPDADQRRLIPTEPPVKALQQMPGEPEWPSDEVEVPAPAPTSEPTPDPETSSAPIGSPMPELSDEPDYSTDARTDTPIVGDLHADGEPVTQNNESALTPEAALLFAAGTGITAADAALLRRLRRKRREANSGNRWMAERDYFANQAHIAADLEAMGKPGPNYDLELALEGREEEIAQRRRDEKRRDRERAVYRAGWISMILRNGGDSARNYDGMTDQDLRMEVEKAINLYRKNNSRPTRSPLH
jgi:hypothetical protein